MNVTTVLANEQYSHLALDILPDNSYYIILNRNPASTIEQKSNKLIRDLEKCKMLSQEESKYYKNYNSAISKFYGLSKIHKPY